MTPRGYIGAMAATDAHDDNLDLGLTDNDLESEIELVSELVLAATSSDGPLHQDEVDHILGLGPAKVTPVKSDS
jgi:hypothetical protein